MDGMTETVSVRFCEYSRYDVEQDARVVVFLAMTDTGSYHAEVPQRTGLKHREAREAFKVVVLGKMQLGQPPCEVRIG